jgi:hypothetical protein
VVRLASLGHDGIRTLDLINIKDSELAVIVLQENGTSYGSLTLSTIVTRVTRMTSGSRSHSQRTISHTKDSKNNTLLQSIMGHSAGMQCGTKSARQRTQARKRDQTRVKIWLIRVRPRPLQARPLRSRRRDQSRD